MNVSVSVRRTALMAALAVLVLMGLARPLPAADDAPFAFAGVVEFVKNVNKYHVFAWEGRANHLGRCTGLGLVWSRGFSREAEVTLENDQGDSIHQRMPTVGQGETSLAFFATTVARMDRLSPSLEVTPAHGRITAAD